MVRIDWVRVWAIALCGGLTPLAPVLADPADKGATSQVLAGDVQVPADWQPLHERWERLRRELRVAGIAIVAVRGDQVVLLDALGTCDAMAAQSVQPRSPFYLASVTKSFTALGVAMLADEGKLDLDDPVRKHLPRFKLADAEAAARITLRDLLCHRPGLDSQPIAQAEAYLGNLTEDRYYRWLERARPLGQFQYTNLHFTLLGRVIEAVTGQAWQDYLAARVFQPLGMADATCYASRLYANPLAAQPLTIADQGWQDVPLRKHDAVMHAAGGMGASAVDLGHWIAFHLSGRNPQGQSLLSEPMLAEVHRQQVSMAEAEEFPRGVVREGYSLGWFTGHLHGRRMLEHGGGYLGTATLVSLLPEDQVGVAVLINESRGLLATQIALDVYAQLLGLPQTDLVPELKASLARIEERARRQSEASWDPPGTARGLTLPIQYYLGQYENEDWGTFRVTEHQGELRFRLGQQPARSHSLAPNRFRYEAVPGQAFAGEFQLSGGQVRGLVAHTPTGKCEFRKVD